MNEKMKQIIITAVAVVAAVLLTVLIFVLSSQKTVTFIGNDEYFTVDIKGEVKAPAAKSIEGLEFVGWYSGDKLFDGDVKDGEVYTARYTAKQYDVVFKNYDGTVIASAKMSFGDVVTAPEQEPERDSDQRFHYVFNGYIGFVEGMTVSGNMEFIADYYTTQRSYTVSFLINGKVYFTTQAVYGQEISVALPELTGYEFSGWECGDKLIVTGDAVYDSELLCIAEELNKMTTELDDFVANITIGFYTDEALEQLKDIAQRYKAVIAMQSSIQDGETVLEEAYSEMEEVESYPKLIEQYAQTLGKDNYFEKQWNEINEIIDYTMFRLKNYKSGVPTREAIFSECKKQLDEILTKQEDMALADWMRDKKLLIIKSYVEDFKDKEIYGELVKMVNSAEQELRQAVSSDDVNTVYLKWLELIKMTAEG